LISIQDFWEKSFHLYKGTMKIVFGAKKNVVQIAR